MANENKSKELTPADPTSTYVVTRGNINRWEGSELKSYRRGSHITLTDKEALRYVRKVVKLEQAQQSPNTNGEDENPKPSTIATASDLASTPLTSQPIQVAPPVAPAPGLAPQTQPLAEVVHPQEPPQKPEGVVAEIGVDVGEDEDDNGEEDGDEEDSAESASGSKLAKTPAVEAALEKVRQKQAARAKK